LLDNAPRAGAEFLRTKDQFAAAIAAADEALEPLADEASLRELFAANDRFARAGIALLARHGDNLASGIKGLADLMTFQLANKEGVLQSLQHLPGFLHAVEDASIPWESPEGRRYYRIRTGLIFENVPSSWPCGYKVSEDYTRLPHVRGEKRVLSEVRCRNEEPTDEEAAAVATSIVEALETWVHTQPVRSVRTVVAEPAGLWERPAFRFLSIGS
jgi:hypothetical protein